jgi:integrase
MRHAAESEAIPGNPLSLVRAPRPTHRDAVEPLSPAEIEAIRQAMLDPPAREVARSVPGQRRRNGYLLKPPGTTQSRHRDAVIVSLLAYAGLRPGELRALRHGDIHDNTLHVQRAADEDGAIKPTKNNQKRVIRLLSPLAHDLREYRLATGRPSDSALVLADHDRPWDKTSWQMWRADRWVPACRAAGFDPIPRPYDLRHSFASLLLAEGRQPLFVARQLGHSLAVLLATYARAADEYAEPSVPIDAEREIAQARWI